MTKYVIIILNYFKSEEGLDYNPLCGSSSGQFIKWNNDFGFMEQLSNEFNNVRFVLYRRGEDETRGYSVFQNGKMIKHQYLKFKCIVENSDGEETEFDVDNNFDENILAYL